MYFEKIKVNITSLSKDRSWTPNFFRRKSKEQLWPFVFTIVTETSNLKELSENYTDDALRFTPQSTINDLGSCEIVLLELELEPKLNGPLEKAFVEFKDKCSDPYIISMTRTFGDLGLKIKIQKIERDRD